jgi:S-adenosyl methyltransferase
MTGESSYGQGDLSRLNVRVPHPARVYDVWLGGKDNFEADRAAAQAGLEAFPFTIQSVRANRAFLARVVKYLVAEAGIRQFLDIGTGLPSADNTHEVAQGAAAESRVVYVDNDPIVLLHAQALLTSTEPGATDYVDADLREPGKILEAAARTLDFTQPVAVMLIAILHFIADDQRPRQIVDTLMDAVAPGSYLAVSHLAKDIFPDELAAFASDFNARATEKVTLRDRTEVSGFFGGLDLIEPGVVQVSQWRPRTDEEAAEPTAVWGGVARKSA